MAFKVNQPKANMNGTHLQGYLDITFQELSLILGDHLRGYDKMKALWVIEGSIQGQYTVATIYDYNSFSFSSIERNTDWHIGGHSERSLELVKRAIQGANIRKYVSRY